MKLSLAEAATVLGRSRRQIRYMIKCGRLPATKKSGHWRIESRDLPIPEADRQALSERLQAARDAFEEGLEPVAKAALPGAEEKGVAKEGKETRRSYSVTDLRAFEAGRAIYRDLRHRLSPDEPAAGQLFESLALLSRGCHCFHPKDKASRFTEARELAATAVASLLLHDGDETELRRDFAERIEQEMIPKVAGLVASYEKRSRRGRFERFASRSR